MWLFLLYLLSVLLILLYFVRHLLDLVIHNDVVQRSNLLVQSLFWIFDQVTVVPIGFLYVKKGYSINKI